MIQPSIRVEYTDEYGRTWDVVDLKGLGSQQVIVRTGAHDAEERVFIGADGARRYVFNRATNPTVLDVSTLRTMLGLATPIDDERAARYRALGIAPPRP